MCPRAVLGYANDSTSEFPAIFDLYWKRFQDFNRLRGVHLTEIQTTFLKKNRIRTYHASGVEGGQPWYRFLSKVFIKVDDVVTIAPEVQDDRERGEHGKFPVCLISSVMALGTDKTRVTNPALQGWVSKQSRY